MIFHELFGNKEDNYITVRTVSVSFLKIIRISKILRNYEKQTRKRGTKIKQKNRKFGKELMYTTIRDNERA